MPLLGVTGSDVLAELRVAVGELCLLGADAAVCVLLWSTVRSWQCAIERLREAPIIDVDLSRQRLLQLLREAGRESGVFVGVRGFVQPVSSGPGAQLVSRWREGVTGVIRRETFSQLSDSRAAGGFWSRRLRVLHDVTSSVPFALSCTSLPEPVRVLEPERAWRLDLSTVHEQFEPAPAPTSLTNWLWQWLAGEQARGVHKHEQMLLVDSPVTSFGRLSQLPGSQQLQLSQPADGLPFVVSCEERPAMLEAMARDRSATWWTAAVFTAAGALYGAWLAWRVTCALSRRRARRKLMLQFDSIRTQRRRRERDTGPVVEAVQCVVCLTNPRELVLSPCQHVCLCVDCEEQLTRRVCPVCREHVHRVRPAYIS